MPQFWKVRNILFWKRRVLQNSTDKSWETFAPHSLSHLSWFEVPPCQVSEISSTFHEEAIRWANYNFHTHVQYCITIHYHSCSIDKYRNVKHVKCYNVGKLGISHFEKAGHLSSGQLDLTLYHSWPSDTTSCSIDKYWANDGSLTKCLTSFGRLGISWFWEGRILAKLHASKAGDTVWLHMSAWSQMLSWFEVDHRCEVTPMLGHLKYHLPFRGTYLIDKLGWLPS